LICYLEASSGHAVGGYVWQAIHACRTTLLHDSFSEWHKRNVDQFEMLAAERNADDGKT
jgi:hypothetical protein